MSLHGLVSGGIKITQLSSREPYPKLLPAPSLKRGIGWAGCTAPEAPLKVNAKRTEHFLHDRGGGLLPARRPTLN